MARGSRRPSIRPPELRGRQEVVRAAIAAGVANDEVDRARVLGQVAELLLAHPKLKRNLAYKGGAVMYLVDGSPRRSNDLDAHAVTSWPIKKEWIIAAFETREARKIVFGPPRRFRLGNDSITILDLACRAPSGGAKVQVTVNITWSSPLCLPPAEMRMAVGTESITIPVMHRTERCAEKLDAFLFRDEVNDTHDLFHYRPLVQEDHWKFVFSEVISVKLAHDDRVGANLDAKALFAERLTAAEKEWARNAAALKIPAIPIWAEIAQRLRRYRDVLPDAVDKSHRRPDFGKRI